MTTIINIDDNTELHITEGSDILDNPNNEESGEDNIFLVADHRQFSVEYNTVTVKNIEQEIDNVNETSNADVVGITLFNANYYVYSLYAYIHSGVSLRRGLEGCRWDTSSVGYILLKSDIYDDKEENEKYVDRFIEIWNTYLSTPGYYFTLYKKQYYTKTYVETKETETGYDLEEIDSCGGFIEPKDIIGYLPELSEDTINQIKNI